MCPGRELNPNPTAFGPVRILTELLRLLLLLMMMMIMMMTICKHEDVTGG